MNTHIIHKIHIIKIIIIIIVIALLFFYRYPFWLNLEHVDERAVSCPAYGKIMDIRQQENGDYYIAIFLSPFDIHYQFSPVDGEIIDKQYDATGKFELAYELNKSHENEKAIYTIRNRYGYGDIKVFQIAGTLARRITSICNVHDEIRRGDPMGLIHFGSRVDIIIPNGNIPFQLNNIKKGETVSPNTILGWYI